LKASFIEKAAGGGRPIRDPRVDAFDAKPLHTRTVRAQKVRQVPVSKLLDCTLKRSSRPGHLTRRKLKRTHA
jgi:hypothetical protein